ncbi:MAG: hypothetical protein J6T13_06155 [Bacteroidales bacterium]|nr:hypothetical protein [Bacteroidales bacterium]MBO7648432.1 hypothetical protein [Bacteroidales bacterium]MCR4858799.1 hypothetical protein [Bacteroidales bacterium]
MKTLKKTAIVLMACATFLFAGCAALTQIVNLVNCKFNLANITDVTWAGINLSNIRSVSDLSMSHLQKAATAILNKDFAISANVNVNVKNETQNIAKLFAFDYDLLLDSSPIASGQNKNHTYTIHPNSTLKVPVPIKADLISIFKNGQVGDVVNFARNLTDYGNGKESNVKVRLTPYAGTSENSIKLPTITLNKTFQ